MQYEWCGKKVEVLLNEMRLPGVPNPAKAGWAIPPTSSGQMILGSIALRQEAKALVANQSVQSLNGL